MTTFKAKQGTRASVWDPQEGSHEICSFYVNIFEQAQDNDVEIYKVVGQKQ